MCSQRQTGIVVTSPLTSACLYCSIEDVKQMISKELSARGDNLVSFGDDVKFLYFRYSINY